MKPARSADVRTPHGFDRVFLRILGYLTIQWRDTQPEARILDGYDRLVDDP